MIVDHFYFIYLPVLEEEPNSEVFAFFVEISCGEDLCKFVDKKNPDATSASDSLPCLGGGGGGALPVQLSINAVLFPSVGYLPRRGFCRMREMRCSRLMPLVFCRGG